MTMRKTSLISAAAAIVVLAGCANDGGTSGMPGENVSASASASPSTSAFNDTDIMFVQMMLPHHDQAVSMSELLLDKRGVHPEVVALARQIRDTQQAEIDTMNGWFDAMGRPEVEAEEGGPHHAGLDGMLTELEMQTLDMANARDGQRLFLEGMIKHHGGAIEMAQKGVTDGQHPGLVDLAKRIAENQQQEVEAMTGLLTKI
jgi:uncharacterized protein (DUF305 family)